MEVAEVTMSEVVIYLTPWCPYCVRAKQLLKHKGQVFKEIDVSRRPDLRQKMQQKSGCHTVPQIWINEEHIGGCDELYQLEQLGQLDKKLNTNT